jgi:hypothetical protein
MPRKTKPPFIVELALQTSQADANACAVALDAARNIYNAALGEGLRRLDLMRQSKAYQAARTMPKGQPKSAQRKARAAALRHCHEAFDFTGYGLQLFAQQCRDRCWIKDHLPGHVCQTASLRAYNAVVQYAFGKRGRPRFKRRNEYNSFEGKEAKSTIIWRNGTVRFSDRIIPAILEPNDAWQVEALRAPTKYCRVIRRTVHGQPHWYGQLAQEGYTPLRRVVGWGVIGLDIGPSNIAVVGHGEAAFEQFCPTVKQPWNELRRIERGMDRSRRATNPQCFNADGTWQKGAKAINRSKRYQKLSLRRKERERRLAAERRRCHGELANRVVGGGTTVKTEKLSYKAWQRQYGRSAKVRGAGVFVSMLGNKLKAAGGELIEFGTRYTCLSRFDHIDGTLVKKPLNQRFHQFSDGTRIGRDLYSAFLARFVHEDRLDASQAQKAWPTSEAMLRAASDNFEPASGRGFALAHVMLGVGAGRSKKPDRKLREAGDAVAQARAPESGAIWSNPGGT